ncbi:oxygen-independent coproporphyrinogen-3 oxidase [Sphingobium sp. B1D7B]|uniref:oxygen-independent coproporphyrinogen III oxidase n=1 Tax=unclassified Sphingobium TaxID=2611147 RepID=UPI0022255C19|nr:MULTISPECIES: oxygen-independent coproporphyrinogen III oxidase [unclassified Sphingobium]MCW2390435.1 oxygen-independent coproporphyrinogen-3 oxidase [Sphingobium sp. B11D3A]MCW2405576.1 oxygen-independent coproporphyrinogen-3 oxidase [Sphingobium sp. B1D7B]MCW2412533.1 oxygen-independent coproporphyrinogen-3 oxidase [Sphingobium sp. B8D3D]MCW2415170.1 oxygen-independent coproporphyrinogen-3 oxidase [Sphingobium sp. B8D3A]
MWSYYPDLLARPVPRYTSYPTAAEFTDRVGEAYLGHALDAVQPGQPVSLYVHIPFCEEICWYCGCNTGRSNKAQRLTSYLDALHAEIRTVAQRLGGRARVERIAFGGGSPNAIPPLEFARLVDEMMLAFNCGAPVLSVEIDPRGFDQRWAMTLGVSGTKRASLGVQTFDPAIQAAIGRVQPRDLIVSAVDRLRSNGVRSINFDLMYGLPGQDRALLEQTLDEAIAMRPDRIALFGYAHVPHMLPRQKRIDATHLPDQAERFAMAALGHDQLVAAGYVPVGFDHFALPHDDLAKAQLQGTLRRNFQGFTEDRADVLIGIGATAIGQFPHLIVQNDKNSGRYRMRAGAGRLTGERGILRDADDQRRGAIIEDLLCGRAANVGTDLHRTDLRAGLAPFLERGLATLEGNSLRITEEGRPYGRAVAVLFDRHRALSQQRFSSAI